MSHLLATVEPAGVNLLITTRALRPRPAARSRSLFAASAATQEG
jgi:hypothetical protein